MPYCIEGQPHAAQGRPKFYGWGHGAGFPRRIREGVDAAGSISHPICRSSSVSPTDEHWDEAVPVPYALDSESPWAACSPLAVGAAAASLPFHH